MNEITRIHLAKTPYNVELPAKKELEAYVGDIAKVMKADDETMYEIELRMVELLAVRNIYADGVITKPDVQAVITQLGSPRDFQGDDETRESESVEPEGRERVFLRDETNGWLAGICAGLAAYTGLDVRIVRLAVIVLTLMSFGTMIAAYIVIWLLVPAAHTKADQLKMRGKKVDITSLTEIAETVERSKIMKIAVRFISIFLGLILSLLAVGGLILTTFITTSAIMHMDMQSVPLMAVAIGLWSLAGILFTIFCTQLAISAAQWTMTPRMKRSIMVTMIAGLAVSIPAIVIMVTNPQMTTITKIESRDLPELVELKDADVSIVYARSTNNTGVPSMAVHYISDGSRPRIEARRNGLTHASYDVTAGNSSSGKQLMISDADSLCGTNPFCMSPSEIVIYGPALRKVVVSDRIQFSYESMSQETIAIEGATYKETLAPEVMVRLDMPLLKSLDLSGGAGLVTIGAFNNPIETLTVHMRGGQSLSVVSERSVKRLVFEGEGCDTKAVSARDSQIISLPAFETVTCNGSPLDMSPEKIVQERSGISVGSMTLLKQ